LDADSPRTISDSVVQPNGNNRLSGSDPPGSLEYSGSLSVQHQIGKTGTARWPLRIRSMSPAICRL